MAKRNILAIIGSASENSSNERLIEYISGLTKEHWNITVFNDLKSLPPFDPALSIENTPRIILHFRNQVNEADGILICTPEYVFSIPSGLKNAIEWSVATTVFSDKPTGLITASADGKKGHEELQLIMKTLMARFTPASTLLIPGIKGKINSEGHIADEALKAELARFTEAFSALLDQ